MVEWPRTVEGVVISSGFWASRRVFLTGHTGFKGAWLSFMLSRLSAVTSGYALAPPDGPNLFDLAGVRDLLEVDGRADICDGPALQAAMADADPEIIFHLAAQPLVKASYMAPVETYRVNVLGAAHVLEAARRLPNVKAVVIVTSDKCYEPVADGAPHREGDHLGGHDPYASSKACAELVAQAYRRSFFHDRNGPRVVTARSGNVIGGGDFAADRIVPDAIRAFAAGKPVSVRNPLAVRPWQHVLDPLCGYLLLAEHAAVGARDSDGAWNFGPAVADMREVGALVARMIEAWGAPAAWRRDQTEHPPETPLLRLDSSRARRELGWRTLLDFEAAIEWTCDWHRAHALGHDMRAATFQQVDAYLGQCVRVTTPMATLAGGTSTHDVRAARRS